MDTIDSRDAMPGLGRYAIAERSFLSRVFGWMGFGLLLTAFVAWYVGTPERFAAIFGASRAVIWIAFIGAIVRWLHRPHRPRAHSACPRTRPRSG